MSDLLTILLIINIGLSEIVRFVMPRAFYPYTISSHRIPDVPPSFKIHNNMDMEQIKNNTTKVIKNVLKLNKLMALYYVF